jgi:L-threonylcarbamoyladenylate synthase
MTDTEKCLRVDPVRPEASAIQTAGQILSRNGIVIFPAACLYGVAANALSPEAVEKVFSLKQRPQDNPILVLVRNRAMLERLVNSVPPQADILMESFWPGGLTLVFDAADHISPQLTAGTGKIGIRMPRHPVARALARSVDLPITGTSANLSGAPGCTRVQDLAPSILEQADLILDAGEVKGGMGSTIADVTTTPVKILREGAVSAHDIFGALASN